MARTGQQLVDQVKIRGFDADDPTILGWLDERQKTMVAEARSRKKRISLGSTVAGTQSYNAPVGIVEIIELTVGGATYTKAPHRSIADVASSQIVVDYPGLLYVVDDDTSAVEKFALIPTPTQAGDAIEAFCAVEPPDMTLGGSIYVPDRYARVLVQGAIATGADLASENPGEADRYEARFDAGVEKYRRWEARRNRGSGPTQIRVAGINA